MILALKITSIIEAIISNLTTVLFDIACKCTVAINTRVIMTNKIRKIICRVHTFFQCHISRRFKEEL